MHLKWSFAKWRPFCLGLNLKMLGVFVRPIHPYCKRLLFLYWNWAIARLPHYIYVITTTMASQITSLMVVYSIVYSDADQRKHQSSASLAFVWGIHRDRWIPRTKGQLSGKFFHLMTSSYPNVTLKDIGNLDVCMGTLATMNPVLTCPTVARAQRESGYARSAHVLAPMRDAGPTRGTVLVSLTCVVVVAW